MDFELVGLVPAAGWGRRLSPLPFSKEVYPIGFHDGREDTHPCPKVVSQYLLENMERAGVRKTYIILRDGKWDIPGYFKDGTTLGLNLAYLVVGATPGVPYTLDYAFPFVKDSTVVFGFPDILFRPADAFIQLLGHLKNSEADVVLGLFPTNQTQRMDMVEVKENHSVSLIQVKPSDTHLRHTWIIAVWTPTFATYMHDFLMSNHLQTTSGELYLGNVFQAAINQGKVIHGLIFHDGEFMDIGMPDNLIKAVSSDFCS